MNHEDRNYFSDFRVVARDARRIFESLNPTRKVGLVKMYTDDGEEYLHVVPYKLEVCPTCEGEGKHVNPSIDASGISHADLAEWSEDEWTDEGEEESSYMSGKYDVPCYQCQGAKVVPVIDTALADPEIVQQIADQAQADREFAAEERAERMMGA